MSIIDRNEFNLIPTICCWYDLLGYGTPFIESSWDLRNPKCIENYKRIDQIGSWGWGYLSLPFGPRMVLNDGIAACLDVPSDLSKAYEFLCYFESIIFDYNSIRTIDERSGYPGVRGVISCGDRYEYDTNDTSVVFSPFEPEEGRTCFYHPREFQMNTAFSKAFIMEESGKKAGVSGSNLYVDRNTFSLIDDLLKKCDGEVKLESSETSIIYTLLYKKAWFATIDFYPDTVQYDAKGIKTELLRFKKIDSLPEQQSKEAAYQQAVRFSLMEKYAEENGEY